VVARRFTKKEDPDIEAAYTRLREGRDGEAVHRGLGEGGAILLAVVVVAAAGEPTSARSSPSRLGAVWAWRAGR